MPASLQALGWWARPVPFLERCRARYGKTFTIRLVAQEPFVMLSDPDDLKAVFTASPDVLHPGEGARILEPIVGPTSILLLDGERHLSQRKLVLPAFHGDRIAVRFAYEWHDAEGQWCRSHGNEQWEFDEAGLMRRREASINDVPIAEADRLFRWPLGPRPDGHPGLSDLGL